jgi:hypothetical protein
MASEETTVVTKQPAQQSQSQPKGDHSNRRASFSPSYDSGIVHPQGVCCLPGWLKGGEDPRWYYPYDKGMIRMCCLVCMWWWGCTFVPCCLCWRTGRYMICCVDMGCWHGSACEHWCPRDKDVNKVSHSDDEEKQK